MENLENKVHRFEDESNTVYNYRLDFIKKLYDFNPNINFIIILITNDNQTINIPNIKKYVSNIPVTDWKRPELNWKEVFHI